jgi:hypothetical protein
LFHEEVKQQELLDVEPMKPAQQRLQQVQVLIVALKLVNLPYEYVHQFRFHVPLQG